MDLNPKDREELSLLGRRTGCVCVYCVCVYFPAPFIFQSGLDRLCFLPLRTHVVHVRCVFLPYLVPLKIPRSLIALFTVYLGSVSQLSLNHFQKALFSIFVMNSHICFGAAHYNYTFGGLHVSFQSSGIKFCRKVKVLATHNHILIHLKSYVQMCVWYNLFKQMLRYMGENLNTNVHFKSIQPLLAVFCLVLQSHDNK